ncbi:MAG: cation transporter [Eubacterium sp.]|nr:cation transporter [Eubacterium sp.]
MVKIIVGIEGMMCGNCEAHVNEAIRKNFQVKQVKASHVDNQAVIIAKNEIPETELKSIIEECGYKMTGVESEAYEKKGLFGLFK